MTDHRVLMVVGLLITFNAVGLVTIVHHAEQPSYIHLEEWQPDPGCYRLSSYFNSTFLAKVPANDSRIWDYEVCGAQPPKP